MTPPAPSPKPRTVRWTIQVCATCGEQAVYPFSCGHRPEPGVRVAEGSRPWTIPVVVRAAYPGEYRAAMAREARMRREAEART